MKGAFSKIASSCGVCTVVRLWDISNFSRVSLMATVERGGSTRAINRSCRTGRNLRSQTQCFLIRVLIPSSTLAPSHSYYIISIFVCIQFPVHIKISVHQCIRPSSSGAGPLATPQRRVLHPVYSIVGGTKSRDRKKGTSMRQGTSAKAM